MERDRLTLEEAYREQRRRRLRKRWRDKKRRQRAKRRNAQTNDPERVTGAQGLKGSLRD